MPRREAPIVLTLDYGAELFHCDDMLTRRVLLKCLVAVPLAACAVRGIPSSARTTVIMVRHADRAGDDLNSIGLARAANLPEALAPYQLDAIYSPDIARNLQTAAPLSQATGLPVTVIHKEYAGSTMTHAHPDGTVIWIGNKGNLRTIWSELSAPGEAPQEYGEIGIVELQNGGVRQVTRLTVSP
ncbi:histidine phosphatase family protein [Roseobacter sp. YSTF-M11]|uniref:Histidine phosphatase family protein n=1 Tax=Roseobacter insulae TaxID=2859783 RepID=A0A9X1FY37_9RHOB|nr:histidine phosphatase family protein [Roseobacter insulae]MBW4709777.1 histidine phosphatase family protein [Roseobacter insulae]